MYTSDRTTAAGSDGSRHSGSTTMTDNGIQVVMKEVEAWLQTQIGKVLYIRKSEQRDMDRIELKLQRVELRRRGETADAYEGETSLILHGAGWTEAEEGVGTAKRILPEASFEIPLVGRCTAVENENGLELATERACYWIER